MKALNNIRDFKELTVWKKSIELAKEAYKLIAALPKEEAYALADQMRRAAVSIPSNIAEGAARSGGKDFLHFLSISLGSEYELQTQLIICTELGYFTEAQTEAALNHCVEVGKMLNAMITKIKSRVASNQKLATSN